MLSTVSKGHKLIALYLLTKASAAITGPYTWWSSAKSTFNTAGKTIFNHKAAYALPVSITTLPTLLTVYQFKTFDSKKFTYPEEPDTKKEIAILEQFIHEELKKQNFPHPEQIKAIPSPSGPGIMDKFFLINGGMREDFIKAGILNAPLYTTKNSDNENVKIWHTINTEESQKKLKEIKMVISHEAGHLIANDFHRIHIMNCCMSLATGFTGLTLLQKLTSRISSNRIKGLLIAASTIPIYALNIVNAKAYSRFRESRADEHVPNEADYLEGGISYLEQAMLREKKLISAGMVPDAYNNKLAYLWYETHPTSESRANRFKERLEKLQQKKLIS